MHHQTPCEFRFPERSHTVGPAWVDGKHDEYRILTSCNANSLRLAAEKGCESISFPMIATGVYGFPKDKALSIAVSAISTFLMDHEMEVYLVVFDPESFQVSSQIRGNILEFIDDYYVAEAEEAEHSVEWDAGNLPDVYGGFEGNGETPAEERDESEEDRILALHRRQEIQLRREWRESRRKHSHAPAAESLRHPHAPVAEAIKLPEEPPEEADYPSVSIDFAAYVAPHSMPELDVHKPPEYDELMKHLGESFRECLFRLINERHLKDSEVYKKANVSKKVFSKIRVNEDYTPKKVTIFALAVSLKLDMDETKDLLSKAGYAFRPSKLQDLIVASFIRSGDYDINDVNLYLFDAGEDLLGSDAV